LIRYDGLKEEMSLANQKIEKMVEMDVLKSNIIDVLNQKDLNNQFIINQQELQIYQYQKMTDDLTNEIKRQNKRTLFWKVATGVAVVTGGILLIK
jgi:predicted oxidoreductase